MSTIADRIREARKIRRLSQAELARRVGLTRGAVWAWESGETKGLTPDNLVRAADALDVEIRWLATGSGPRERQALSPDEAGWVDLYRKLEPTKRQAAREILDPSGEYNTNEGLG